MSLERLPIGKNGMYLEKKPARDGAVYRAKEYDLQTGRMVQTLVQIVDQNTVNYITPIGPILLKNEGINGNLPKLRQFPSLGRRPFELTWRPDSVK